MGRIFLVRHGRTANNVIRRVQGPVLDAPLDELGRHQALELGERFRGEPVDLVLTSPLQRARCTAAPIARITGAPLLERMGLHEYSWGQYCGRVLEGEALDTFERYKARWRRGDLDAAPPGGESPRAAAERAVREIEHTLNRLEKTRNSVVRGPENRLPGEHEATLVVVAHGRLNKMILCAVLHDDLTRQEEYRTSNTGITLLEGSPGAWKARYVDDLSHLSPEARERDDDQSG